MDLMDRIPNVKSPEGKFLICWLIQKAVQIAGAWDVPLALPFATALAWNPG